MVRQQPRKLSDLAYTTAMLSPKEVDKGIRVGTIHGTPNLYWVVIMNLLLRLRIYGYFEKKSTNINNYAYILVAALHKGRVGRGVK